MEKQACIQSKYRTGTVTCSYVPVFDALWVINKFKDYPY